MRCFLCQLQVNLLSKFLLVAKSCYEQRNFATAMQILAGLEHLAVRQCPVSPRGCGRMLLTSAVCAEGWGRRPAAGSHLCSHSRPGESYQRR